MTRAEVRALVRGLAIGTVLGLLLAAALVGTTGDASWIVFSITLGWALGLGIAVWQQRARSFRDINRE